MPSSESMLDKIVKHYVESLHKNGSNIPDNEKISISEALKSKILQEVFIKFKDSFHAKVRTEAADEKRKILKKFKTTLIIETLVIAFLIGIIVNQVTNLIPEHWFVSTAIIVISLLICVLMVFLTLEKD